MYARTHNDVWEVIRDTGDRLVAEAPGSVRDYFDSDPDKRKPTSYPKWMIIKIEGVEEVYEQAEMNDILRIVDKPISSPK